MKKCADIEREVFGSVQFCKNPSPAYRHFCVTEHGYAVADIVSGEAELQQIAVAPYYRGKGEGRMLLRNIIEIVRRHGGRTLFLEVRASNTPALTLYRSFGFKQTGTRRNYYHNPTEDALLLSLLL